MEEGSMKIGYSNSFPYEYTFITATPFSWLEASYKYTEIENRLYGPARYSGNQSYKDKGFDLKLRINQESYYLPQISVGWNDLAGTGLFSSEYISASKRFNNLDFTLGIGWGNLADSGAIDNPMINVSESFRKRYVGDGYGGTFNNQTWFSGDKVSIFSGLEYYLWKYGYVLKFEYDTSSSSKQYERDSRFNFGITRPINKNIDLGLSFENGNQWRFSFSIKSDYGNKHVVRKNDPPKNVVKLNTEQKTIILQNKEVFYRSLNRSLKEESLLIQSADLNSNEARIVIAQNRFRSFPRAIGRTARIASALSPDNIQKIAVTPMNGDIELYTLVLDRKYFDKKENGEVSSNELLSKAQIIPVTPQNYLENEFQPRVRFPEIFFNMSPSLRHQIGGPEAFYLGQIWWKINTKVKLMRGLTLHTVLGLDIYNNFDEFANPSQSTIPKVRSDIQEYLAQGENNIARFNVDYIWSPYEDFFARIDIGYLEEMFGGFGGEIYYRPFDSNLSTSFQFHKVKQRGFKQRFDFKDYEVETGHLSFYYDFPAGVNLQLMMGKYLAGDKGATIDISRRFDTGFTLGIFATKTNLSSEEFGEGSFDKGFYFSIPIDSFFPDYRQGNISFGLHPLTKDGGSSLNLMNPLHSLYGDTKKNSVLRDWQDIND